MPRPPREDVHRHFSPIAERAPSTSGSGATAAADANQHQQHPDDDAEDYASAPATHRAFKHARVRCRHCSWRSKRDASRQAKHLSLCAEYRAWCALHGEQIVSLTAGPKGAMSSPAPGGVLSTSTSSLSSSSRVDAAAAASSGAGTGQAGQASASTSNYYAAGGAASPFGADGAPRRPGSVAAFGQTTTSGAGSAYLSPPVPANPRTGAYQHRNLSYGGTTSGATQQQQQHGPVSSNAVGSGSALGQQYHSSPYARPRSSHSPSHPHDAGRTGFQVQGLGEAERRRLNILYARALVAIGIRDNDFYDRTRHPQMCAFLKALNPGYEPPSKEELGALVVREFFGGMGGGDGSGTAMQGVGDGAQGAESEDGGRGSIFG